MGLDQIVLPGWNPVGSGTLAPYVLQLYLIHQLKMEKRITVWL